MSFGLFASVSKYQQTLNLTHDGWKWKVKNWGLLFSKQHIVQMQRNIFKWEHKGMHPRSTASTMSQDIRYRFIPWSCRNKHMNLRGDSLAFYIYTPPVPPTCTSPLTALKLLQEENKLFGFLLFTLRIESFLVILTGMKLFKFASTFASPLWLLLFRVCLFIFESHLDASAKGIANF